MNTRIYRIVGSATPKQISRSKLFELIEANSWSKTEVLFASNDQPDRIVVMLGDLGSMAVNYQICVYELRPGRFFGKDRMVLVASQKFYDERTKAENWFAMMASAYRNLHAKAVLETQPN